MSRTDELEVVGFDRTEDGVVELDRWRTLAATTLAEESVSRGRLDLIFVEPEEMAELNQAHMGHEGPTDVLSFPLDGEGLGGDPTDDIFADLVDLSDGAGDHTGAGAESPPPIHLGDVVVCPSVASAQATDHAGSVEAELTLLIIHGTLHILGHDHVEPEETELMQGRERVHMETAGFEHPRWRRDR